MSKYQIVSAAGAVAVAFAVILTAFVIMTGERAGAQDAPYQARGVAAAGDLQSESTESTVPCTDPPIEPPNEDPRPVWIELAPPGGTGYPDYKNVTENFPILTSIRLLASVATRAAKMLGHLTTEDDPESDGRCVCSLGTDVDDPFMPFEVHLDVKRKDCTDANNPCDFVQGGAYPIWRPTDLFKGGDNKPKFALKFIDFLDNVNDMLEDLAKALEGLGSGLANVAEIVEKLLKHIDEFTEGYHLGGYSHQRPDLHICIGYGGHGALAQMLNLAGGVSIGGGYQSYNLSKEHRAQFRSGGFAVDFFGNQLNIFPPGIEANIQIDGFKMWNTCKPFGIDVSLLSALPGLPDCPGGDPNCPGGFSVEDHALYDVFHLIESPAGLPTPGPSGCLSPIDFLMKHYYPAAYVSGGTSYTWPRPAFENEDWERRSTAIFSAGLNLEEVFERVEKCTPPGVPPADPCPGPGIPLFTGATLYPKFTLDAGMAWTHEAYGLRDRVQEMVNANLKADPKLEVTDFERGMHDLQAPDSSEDSGMSVYVQPRVAADLKLGFNLSKFLTLGIKATLGVSVKVEPGALGGLIDLNTALAEVLIHSNPPKDLPCGPILEPEQTLRCTNTFAVDGEGHPLSSGEYSCDVDEVFEYRCKAPENDITCDPQSAAQDCPETQECVPVYGCSAHGICERFIGGSVSIEHDTTFAECSGNTVCQEPAINAGVLCGSSDDCPAPSTCVSGNVGEACNNDADCAEDACERVWLPTFGGESGMNNAVRALTVFDGHLIAAGAFTTAGGVTVNRIAKWDGTAWSPLGSGINNTVLTLTVFDGHLIAAGAFSMAGGVPASNIAKWDGTAWSPLGTGMNNTVVALTVFDGHLIAGGVFSTAGGVSASRIAKWDGTAWSPLGSGMDSSVQALTVFDGHLIAGGSFFTAGGVSAKSIAKWHDGTGWSALGTGMNEQVNVLTVFDGHLIAGGHFTTAGGVTVNRVAKWKDAAWSALGSGMSGPVWSLTVFDDHLIAGGFFTTAGGVPANYIAKWDGAWSVFGTGMNQNVFALAVFDGYLIAGGLFTTAGGDSANRMAKWGCPFPGECRETTAPCEQPDPAGYFTSYYCLLSNERKIVGWEGPGCHPLTVGFPSACGCATDDDCVAGFETCIDGACAVDDELVACACDPSEPDACGIGRVCDQGACVLDCSANGDADCAEHQECSDGLCVNPYGIVFAEQVVWKVKNVPVPQHSVHTYGFAEILTSVILDAGVRIGMDLKIFRNLKEFTLLELSKDWVLEEFRKAWYQAGLEARYQNDCDPVAGGVTNWQPDRVKRYNPFAATSGSLGNAGDEEDLFDWCFDTLPNDVYDPPAPTPDDLINSSTDVIQWGEDIGMAMWQLGGVCVTQVIDGQPVSTPFTEWVQDLNEDASGLQCSYTSGTQTDVFPCKDLQNQMLSRWGCLDIDASEWAAALANAFPERVTMFNGTPVFDLNQMLIDPDEQFEVDNIRPEILNYPGGAGLVGFHWYVNVSMCFVVNHEAMQPGDLALVDVEFGPCCGNGVLDQQGCETGIGPCEECDDGNNVAGDGCSPLCRIEIDVPFIGCGDGIVQPGLGEECDGEEGCGPDCRWIDDCCCEGDLNDDGVIDQTDVVLMQQCLDSGSCDIDVNCDGVSDVRDLNAILCLKAGFTKQECCGCDQEPAPGVCPGNEPCGLAHGTPGCNDGGCCETVCAADPTCCSQGWGPQCVALAADLCSCIGACVDEAWCYDPGGDPGFDCCGVGNCPCLDPSDPLSQQLCGGCVKAPPGMVMWTPFDAPGRVAYEIAAENHGWIVGAPAVIPGAVGNALEFNGVDQYVTLPNAPHLNLGTGDLTIDAWIRTTASSGVQHLVDKRTGPIGSVVGYTMFLLNGELAFQLADGDHTNYLSGAFVADGTWRHVAVTVRRGEADGGRFYVDGALVETFNPTGRMGSLNNNAALWIARRHPINTVLHYTGAIDEVEIFRRALSAGEIQAIFNAGSEGKCKLRCHTERVYPFCWNQNSVTVPVAVCNDTEAQAPFQLSFAGLPAAPPGCNMAGPTSFNVLGPNPVDVPPYTCVTVDVSIDRPAGMDAVNLVSCYEVTIQNLNAGRTATCNGSVWNHPRGCARRIEPVLSWPLRRPPESPQPIVFEVENTTIDLIVAPVRIVAYGPDMTPSGQISLNGLPPGEPWEQVYEFPPGVPIEVAFEAMFVEHEGLHFSDIVLYTDIDGDDEYEALASVSIHSTAAECVRADFNGDGVVDEDDFALFVACATGPDVLYDPQNLHPACTLVPDAQGMIAADFDRDGDVDQMDFALFQRCSSDD